MSHRRQFVSDRFVSPPIYPAEGHVSPHCERQSPPERRVTLASGHFTQALERFQENPGSAAGCGCLHSRAKHFDGAHGDGGCDSGYGSREEWGVGVGNVVVDGAVGTGAEGVVAGEVDDVCGDGHDEGRGETSPEGCGTFVSSDLAETVEG